MISKYKHKMSSFMNSIFHLTEISVENGFFMELNNEGILSVEGCEDIKLYTDTEIILDCDQKTLIACGNGLNICNYKNKSVSVSGELKSVRFI